MLKFIMMFLLIVIVTAIMIMYNEEKDTKRANIWAVTYWALTLLTCLFAVKG